VLILDEPTFGLDVMAARAVVDTVRAFRDEGRTILFSTHIMDLASKLCDRIGILHRSRLRALGTLAELKARFGKDDLEEVFFAAAEATPAE
jgi:sodium transport system ATP-binding protein